MPKNKESRIAPVNHIIHSILVLREQKVMLDRDLAELYQVKAIALRQQVKRNLDRFPQDFMFQLTQDEANLLVSRFNSTTPDYDPVPLINQTNKSRWHISKLGRERPSNWA